MPTTLVKGGTRWGQQPSTAARIMRSARTVKQRMNCHQLSKRHHSQGPGRLRVIRDGKLLPKPAWQAPEPPAGSPPSNNAPDLLHFVELHPAFAHNGLVYLSYPKHGPGGNTIAVGPGKLTGEALSDFKEISTPRSGRIWRVAQIGVS